MEINQAQDDAISIIDKNLIVSAGAGTGKTSVLTRRYLEILERGDLNYGEEVESIVAITFTKKASKEMVDRIRKQISEKFDEDDKWSRFYEDMERANISTIHSFCSKLLREKPIEGKVDPMFEVLEDYTSKKLLRESVREVLNSYILSSKEFFDFLRLFKKNHTDEMVEEFISIYNEIRTYGDDFQSVLKLTKDKIESISFGDGEIEEIKALFLYLMEVLGKTSKIVKMKDNPSWQVFLNGTYSEEDLLGILMDLKNNMSTSKKEVDKLERLNYLLDMGISSFEGKYMWAYDLVIRILIDIDRNYEGRKNKINGLDYDDLQIKTMKLLEKDYILRHYQNRFKYIMIDEYQDTNELQKKIFYKLASVNSPLDRNNLFVVGDPKQSIYGFRGADISVFYETMEDISKNGENIVLEKNYRTCENVLAFINESFKEILKDKYVSLLANVQSKYDREVFLIEKDIEADEGESQADLLKDYEAKSIAREILDLVETGKYKYGDFAILFRAGTRVELYENALKNYEIPYYNTIGKGFYKSQELLDLINFLSYISNRRDTISGIGFLKSPIIGMDDNSIYKILSFGQVKEGLDQVELTGLEDEKRIRALKLIEKTYSMKSNYTIYEILDYMLETSFYREKVLLAENGKQKLANINKFMDLVASYDLKNNMDDFLDYMRNMMDQDEAEGQIESEFADVIRIITIHKAKGLEFPVVVLPEMGTRPPIDSSLINLDRKLGMGIKFKPETGIHSEISEVRKSKEEEEMKRVLYVAMTRAKERLIIGNQGKSTGFKKLLEGLLETDYVEKIDYDDFSLDEIKTSEDFKSPKTFDLGTTSLKEFEDYNLKTIGRINITQYMEFKKCRRKYYLNYLEKLNLQIFENDDLLDLDDKALSGQVKGNIVHKFCEDYREHKDVDQVLRNALDYYDLDYNEEIIGQLDPYLKNYLKFYSEEYDEIYREQEFCLNLGIGYITGIIDGIYVDGDNIKLVDYKTNRLLNIDKLLEVYSTQLKLYAYVVEKYFRKKVKNVGILFLEKGIYKEIDINETNLKENIEEIREFLEFINYNQDMADYEKCSDCEENCKFYKICNI